MKLYTFSIRFALLSVLLLVVLGCYFAGVILCRNEDLPSRVDLVVVLGGDDGARYVRGRELLSKGFSNRLLLFNATQDVRDSALRSLSGIELSFNEIPRNTWQEANVTRVVMRKNCFTSVIVVSDPPHLLRMRYAWFSNFHGKGISYLLIASNPSWWDARRWWSDPMARRFVLTELPKLIYYFLNYRFGILEEDNPAILKNDFTTAC